MSQPKDKAFIEMVPKLIGEVRASATFLVDVIMKYVAHYDVEPSEEGSSEGPSQEDADDAATLLKSLLGVLWGLISG